MGAARQVALTVLSATPDDAYGPELVLETAPTPVWRVSYGDPYPMEFLVDSQTGSVTQRATP